MEGLAALVALVWFWKKNAETMKSNSTRRVLRGEGAGRFKGATPGVGIVAAGDQSFYLAHLAYELWIQIIATNVFIHNHSIIHSFLTLMNFD